MEITLAHIAPPSSTDPAPVWAELQRIDSDWSRRTLGVVLTVTATQWQARYANQLTTTKHYIVALADPSAAQPGPGSPLGLSQVPGSGPAGPCPVLGFATVELPEADNRHLAELVVVVDIGHQGRGIGSALWEAGERIVRDAGRTTIHAWADYPADPAANRIVPATGVGSIPAVERARFLQRRGLVLQQIERHSLLRLPSDASRLDALLERIPVEADYRLVQWEGMTPPAWQAGMTALHQRMSVDAPSGDLALEEEVWSVERLMDLERADCAGARLFTTAVEHVPSGDLVAYTTIGVQDSQPTQAYQQNTIVTGPHRGHRLGVRAKIANLRYFESHAPRVEAVHTWNAAENTHMLAINDAMGFVPRAVCAIWEKRVAEPGAPRPL